MIQKLLQLLASNRAQSLKAGVQSRIVQAEGDDEATVYLYDAIVGDRLTAEYWGGVCAQDFVPQIAAIKASKINLRVNSPGGDVFAAQAMCTVLKQHSAKITAHIDGIAASAATVIACACDEVIMSPGSMYMIHNAWTFAMGNRHDLQQTVDLMVKIDGQLASQYANKTGKLVDEIALWMDAETWYTADEALLAGFADSLAPDIDKDVSASAVRAWDLSAYSNAAAFCAAAKPDADATTYAADDHRARQQQRMAMSARTRSL